MGWRFVGCGRYRGKYRGLWLISCVCGEPTAALIALRSKIAEAGLILSTTELPEGRAVRSRELLISAIACADDLLASAKAPGAARGRKGETVTAQEGSEHFRQLAAMLKTRAGGRPRKESD